MSFAVPFCFCISDHNFSGSLPGQRPAHYQRSEIPALSVLYWAIKVNPIKENARPCLRSEASQTNAIWTEQGRDNGQPHRSSQTPKTLQLFQPEFASFFFLIDYWRMSVYIYKPFGFQTRLQCYGKMTKCTSPVDTRFDPMKGTIPDRRLLGLCQRQVHQPSPGSQPSQWVKMGWCRWFTSASVCQQMGSSPPCVSSSCSIPSFLETWILTIKVVVAKNATWLVSFL